MKDKEESERAGEWKKRAQIALNQKKLKCKTKARKTKEMNNTVAAINKALARVNSSGTKKMVFYTCLKKKKRKITNGVSGRIKSSKEPPFACHRRTDIKVVGHQYCGGKRSYRKRSNPMIRWHTVKPNEQSKCIQVQANDYSLWRYILCFIRLRWNWLRAPTNAIKSNSNSKFNSIHANVFRPFFCNLFLWIHFFIRLLFWLRHFFCVIYHRYVFWLWFLVIIIFTMNSDPKVEIFEKEEIFMPKKRIDSAFGYAHFVENSMTLAF